MMNKYVVAALFVLLLFSFGGNSQAEFYRKRRKSGKGKGKKSSKKQTPPNKDIYDFVVVGAGSAGPIVARRLADDSHSVLLLDRGPDSTDPKQVPNLPGLDFNEVKVPLFTWDVIESSLTEMVFSDQEIPLFFRRTLPFDGRNLGGQANFNNLIYNRGNADKYDRWNLSGFSFEELLYFFKKSEVSLSHPGEPKYHGYNGLLPVEEQRYKSPEGEAFIRAAMASGFVLNKDTNKGDSDGVSWIQSHSMNGVRVSIYDAFVGSHTPDGCLDVLYSAQATRIIFDENKRNRPPTASKVEYLHFGKRKYVGVKKEVIVSAGALCSPQLLMLSGVGDVNHLQELDIEVVAHNPKVGDGLVDRPVISLLYTSAEPLDAQNPNVVQNETQILNYLLQNPEESVWAQPIAPAFIANKTGKYIAEFAAVVPRTPGSFGIPFPDYAMGFGCVISDHGDSGRVYLRSKDPLAPVGFFTNMLQKDESVATAVQCIKDVRNLVAQPEMYPFILSASQQEIIPTYEVQGDVDLAKFARSFARSGYSLQCSLRLGEALDEDFSVKGVNGVRVVDASVFPQMVDANMVAPIMAMAEKLAEELMEQYAQG